jgi:hypothetical protein
VVKGGKRQLKDRLAWSNGESMASSRSPVSTAPNFASRLNGGTGVAVTQNGAFSFAADLASGTNYTVTMATLPDEQDCTIANETGHFASQSSTSSSSRLAS